MYYFRKTSGSNKGKVGSSENGPYVRNGVEVVHLYWRCGGEQPLIPMHMVEPVSAEEWEMMNEADRLEIIASRNEDKAQYLSEIEQAKKILEISEAESKMPNSAFFFKPRTVTSLQHHKAVMTIQSRTQLLKNIQDAENRIQQPTQTP
jgi:hypothetical protein